jgi:hypothetical protein
VEADFKRFSPTAVKPFEIGFPHDFLGGDPRIDGVPRSIIMAQCGTIDFVQHPAPL